MLSPFPGMNPYLEHETVWHDFHERFIPAMAEVIGAQVRPDYVVKIDEHLFIHELPEESRRFIGRGDVSLAELPAFQASGAPGEVLTAPARVSLPAVDTERLSYVGIRDREDWRLITVIEVLSPCNKEPGGDREQFLGKRGQLLSSPVHYVEIDLLRGNPRLPLRNLAETDYYILVSRAEERPDAGLWPLGLRDRLPVVPIPLRPPHADARLDLQALLDRVYDAAGYEFYIYRHPPRPPLKPDDAQWAQQFLPPEQ